MLRFNSLSGMPLESRVSSACAELPHHAPALPWGAELRRLFHGTRRCHVCLAGGLRGMHRLPSGPRASEGPGDVGVGGARCWLHVDMGRLEVRPD